MTPDHFCVLFQPSLEMPDCVKLSRSFLCVLTATAKMKIKTKSLGVSVKDQLFSRFLLLTPGVVHDRKGNPIEHGNHAALTF